MVSCVRAPCGVVEVRNLASLDDDFETEKEADDHKIRPARFSGNTCRQKRGCTSVSANDEEGQFSGRLRHASPVLIQCFEVVNLQCFGLSCPEMSELCFS